MNKLKIIQPIEAPQQIENSSSISRSGDYTNSPDKSEKQTLWLKIVKKELQALGCQEVEWAYPLFNHIKSKFRLVDIQQITFKLLSDYFWAQYNNHESSEKVKDSTALRLFTQQFNNPNSPTMTDRREFIFSSPRRSFLPPQDKQNNNCQFEIKGLGDNVPTNNHRSVKLTFKSILSDETGNEALRLSSKFNRKVLVIRDQIEQKSHPIHKIIKKFDLLFFQLYAVQIERCSQKGGTESKALMNQIVKEVQIFVKIIFLATMKFYRLDLKPQDLRKDLVINMITSLIMKDQTYSIIINAILQGNSDRVKSIQRNIGKYRYKINLDKLGVSKYFQFSKTFKDLIQQDTSTMAKSQRKEANNEDAKLEQLLVQQPQTKSKTFKKKRKRNNSFQKDVQKPFEKTIEALKEIPEINSPMKKLEFIYQVFNTLMIGEIDQFWENTTVDQKKLEIDYENLNGIAIYIALKSGIPILLIDIIFIENFVSKAILNTNRAYQMTVLHSAMTFIEDNLPSYYESKDKKNPLKENFTPKFVYNESVMLSPRSLGQSMLMSKLGQSFNQLTSEQTSGQEDFDPEKEEDMLFCMETVSMSKNLESQNQVSKQRKLSSDLEQERNNSAQSKSQLQSSLDQDSSVLNQHLRNKNFCNIHPNAAKMIHQMLNKKLHTQSMIGISNKLGFNKLANGIEQMNICGSLDNTSPKSVKEQFWNLNIYNDYDRLMSSYMIEEGYVVGSPQTRDQTKSNKHFNNLLTTEHDEMRVDLDQVPSIRLTDTLEQFNTSNEYNLDTIK